MQSGFPELTIRIIYLFSILYSLESYSCSRGLVFPLKPKSTGEWVANGLIIVNKKVSMDFLLSNIDLVSRYMNPLDPLFKDHWIKQNEIINFF